MRGNWIAGLVALSVAGATAPATADNCQLNQLGSVDMSEAHNAALIIPVSIEGTPKMMAIDTGSVLTGVDPQAADDLHLIRKRIMQGALFTSAGQSFTEMATIHAFDIGQMHAENVKILVWPSRMWGDANIAGIVGADLLRNYDVDLDIDAKKFKLFSQDHCPGKVVYWPASAVSVVPIRVVSSGHIIVPVVLDGHNIDALLDTGAFGTVLSLETAENTFGLQPNTPEMTPSGEFHGAVPMYRHTFKSLELEGISIGNPTVFIWDDQMKYGMQQTPQLGSRLTEFSEQNGKTDLILGMRELRHLHIYIAYKEQKLYVSAVAPPPAANSANTPPASGAGAAPSPPK
jgi:predicted aspartyl protease